MREHLYKIADIAKFYDVTTTTLRYYEKYGLLKPAFVDKQTKYRYYDIHNVNTLGYILGLRKTGMGMARIKQYFNGEFSIIEHINNLKQQRFYIEKQIKANEALITTENAYDVDYITYPITPYIKKDVVAADINELSSMVLEFLNDCIKSDVSISENCLTFIEYDTIFPVFTDIKASLGFEIKGSKKNIGLFRPQMNAIRTFHKGSYESIGDAYDALRKFADANDIKLTGNAIEYQYESFSLHQDPDDFLSEVIFPIAEA